MAKRYRFRKVYMICEDKKIFGDVLTALCYQDQKHALSVCNHKQHKAIQDANMMYNANKPIPVHKVHGFYLVHESLFDEILKKHSK